MSQLTLHNFEFRAMGTPCALRLYAENVAVAASAFQVAATEINRLEEKYSRYKKGNYLYRINEAAKQGSSTSIDEEFASILSFADACYQQSDGLFDITSGILRKAWDFSATATPKPELIDQIMAGVGWNLVEIDGLEIRFLRAGMELDLGGIVKEYAVDKAAALCKDQHIQHGIVDMGGDMHIIGPHPDGKPWHVKIRHPESNERGLASIAITQGAIASSGDYERCVEIDNKRYSHILSPITGWPVRGVTAVSTVAAQCVIAGSACTIAMLKASKGVSWLNELGIDYVALDVNNTTYHNNTEAFCHIIKASDQEQT